MTRLTKKAKQIQEKVTPGKLYPVDEALGLLQELATVKFKESVDVSINLGVDPRKSDQVVRSSTVLPNGTGKTVRVAVFTQRMRMRRRKPVPTLSGWKISRKRSRRATWILMS